MLYWVYEKQIRHKEIHIDYYIIFLYESQVCLCENENGGEVMQDVRNGADKLVCRIDKASKTVEIVLKGFKTIVRFLDNGQVLIENVSMVA